MMNDEQDFDKLRTLLTLKNHEQPPPGYFNRLPGKILARIEASELASQSTWWDWLVARFDARPILACAYGFTISGLLLMGFRLSQVLQADAKAETGAPSLGGGWLAAAPDPITTQPGSFLQSRFANPAGLATFSSMEPAVDRTSHAPQSSGIFQPVNYSFSH
ncbi:MAG TPA: hypothetical protein VM680_04825 [Verrucomicrobiae bacterium]|nr:hypothetical protein [Verrucomicrobiae bacterium]